MHTHMGTSPNGAEASPGWAGSASAELLLEVDFKWLMAGQGCWIDPDRLRADPQYAGNCLRAAISSPCEALRRCARALGQTLGPSSSTRHVGAAPA